MFLSNAWGAITGDVFTWIPGALRLRPFQNQATVFMWRSKTLSHAHFNIAQFTRLLSLIKEARDTPHDSGVWVFVTHLEELSLGKHDRNFTSTDTSTTGCILISNHHKEIARILITHRQLNLASLWAAGYTDSSTTHLPVLPIKPNYHSDLLWVQVGWRIS